MAAVNMTTTMSIMTTTMKTMVAADMIIIMTITTMAAVADTSMVSITD